MASVVSPHRLNHLVSTLPGVKSEVWEAATALGVKAEAYLRSGPYSEGNSEIKVQWDSPDLTPGRDFTQDAWVLLVDPAAYSIEYGFGRGDDGEFLYAGAKSNAPLRRAVGDKPVNIKDRAKVRLRRRNLRSRRSGRSKGVPWAPSPSRS
ncbi:hypothetical protein EDD28_0070 [Salana multivorans]|uniref:Uncharacterized protein n=1 Tax=Salana multivorans TaxID=120377 RepID=A0A3N2D7U1_9MICO|nr:hypothetical protein [Salana multivorans]ROR95514.1 hypothetical protein EDD28_0070 [Salana multivorans]